MFARKTIKSVKDLNTYMINRGFFAQHLMVEPKKLTNIPDNTPKTIETHSSNDCDIKMYNNP
jgi:hypothetical protein